MKRFRKIIIFGLMMCIGLACAYTPVKAVTKLRTKIDFVGLDRSIVLKGTKQTFYLTSEGAEDVQYRIWVRYPGTNNWEDITKGYTTGVRAKDLYAVTPDKVLGEGNFYGSIWVKKAGEKGLQHNSNGDFDSYYTFEFSVKNNGMDLDKNVMTDKEEYKLGDSVRVDSIEGLRDVEYRIHAYDVENNKWINNIDGYKKNGLTWKPQHTGKYMLDVWVKKIGSPAKWEAFKLKPIEVKASADGKTELPENVDNISGSIEGLDKVLEGKTYKGSYIIRDEHLLMSTSKEMQSDIKPSHKIESVVNPNLEEQVYKMIRIMTNGGYYPIFSMTSKGDYMFAQDDLRLYINCIKQDCDSSFVNYRFFRNDVYKDAGNTGDYKGVVDIHFDNNINNKNNMKTFRMCNKVILGEKSDEITDYMLELFNRKLTEEDRRVYPSKDFGDIRVCGMPGDGKDGNIIITMKR